MFDRIAPTYDRLNHALSWNIDRGWRKKAIDSLLPYSPQSLLDVATGTGDFAILAYERLHPTKLVGMDLSQEMMEIARDKADKRGYNITFEQGDSMALTYPDARFDAVTVAFGVRNFEHLEQGLSQMCRVLKRGGHLVILELSTPRYFPMRQLFFLYSRLILPLAGRIISHEKRAYRYLPASIAAFPQGEVMQKMLLSAGFTTARFRRLTCGICTLYIATK